LELLREVLRFFDPLLFFELLRFLDPLLLFFELLRFFDPVERFLLLVFVRPSDARSLFTVAAAICFARLVERPFFFALSLMCSYCRSSLLLQAFGMMRNPPAQPYVQKAG
jgi:hypothetical protein